VKFFDKIVNLFINSQREAFWTMKIRYIFYYLLCLFLLSNSSTEAQERLCLLENLQKANSGDFIVTSQNKCFSLLHVFNKTNTTIAIEEICIPSSKVSSSNFSWRDWMAQGAPKNTSWVTYTIDLSSGQLLESFALTKRGWQPIARQDSFFYTLLNLQLEKIPYEQRKRVGSLIPTSHANKRLWQPTIVMDGNKIEGINFDGWKTFWPKDGSELSGKAIEAYTPVASSGYATYFPYWLQVSGSVICAKIRIIDSGKQLLSPASPPLRKAPYQRS